MHSAHCKGATIISTPVLTSAIASCERGDELGPTESGPIRKGEKRAISILRDGRDAPIVCAMPCIRWVVPVPIPIPSTAAEVRRLIAEGYSVAHVAKLTGVSRRTVDRYAWRSASRDRRPLHDPSSCTEAQAQCGNYPASRLSDTRLP